MNGKDNLSTSNLCPDCDAEIGEWCFDWELKYELPPYEYRKVMRPGILLMHPSRLRLITKEK